MNRDIFDTLLKYLEIKKHIEELQQKTGKKPEDILKEAVTQYAEQHLKKTSQTTGN